ncbi:MAG: DUF3696 domain-containing protein [Sphaerochaeta sp.]|nr:DUF3696 domain-containing protein [Sphaerochaeta sp.]
MIQYIQIENFKSLKRIILKTSNLNLFFGLNGMGKSSVIQSLLLLRQSYLTNKGSFDTLLTNGDLISLGTQKDIFFQKADEHSKIRYFLSFEKGLELDLRYTYDLANNDADSLTLYKNSSSAESTILDKIPLFSQEQNFFYLGAEHIGPKKSYETTGWKNNIGITGEYAPLYLAKNGSKKISTNMCNKKAKSDTLFDQVSAWMSEISPGIRIKAELFSNLERVKLSMKYENNRDLTDEFSPVNVGFGIPYVFPIILILLVAKPGDLVLIENPESHLHPRGQSEIAKIIALAANNGVQIFCESHSDHIINGIRVAVKEHTLHNEDLGIFYFSKKDNLETHVTAIEIDEKGELNTYPEGLLDEWGNLMSKLI